MKKVILIAVTLTIFAMMSSLAFAQAGNTASGSLQVSVTVNSSINMVFQKDTNGAAIGGANTPNASLTIMGVQAFGGTAIPGVTVTPGASSFTVSTPVDVVVTKANSTSATYTLSAQLASPDAVNSWTVGGTAVTSASAANVTTSGAYGTTAETIAISIPFTNTSGGVNNTITFLATSN